MNMNFNFFNKYLAFALDSNEDFATLAAEEGISEKKIRTIYSDNDKKGEESDIPINGGGVGMGEIYICYMCYETHVSLYYIYIIYSYTFFSFYCYFLFFIILYFLYIGYRR